MGPALLVYIYIYTHIRPHCSLATALSPRFAPLLLSSMDPEDHHHHAPPSGRPIRLGTGGMFTSYEPHDVNQVAGVLQDYGQGQQVRGGGGGGGGDDDDDDDDDNNK